MIRSDFIEVLDRIEKEKKLGEIFKNCPYHILKKVTLKRYGAGEFALKQGHVYDKMYIIADGLVECYIESEEGKRFYFSPYGKGYFIGELELFAHRPYMCYVEARGELVALELSREVFLEWLRIDNHFHEVFTAFLEEEHYTSMLEVCANMLYSLKQRVCLRLIDSAKAGDRISFSAESLGERLGVTTRSVHRVLKELREKGIIEINHSNVVVLDMERLMKEKDEK